MKRQQIPLLLLSAVFFSVANVQAQYFNTFETNSGSISLGPANTNYAHIYTDRPKFIFNEDIYSYKGGFSSYSIYNLHLKTNGQTRLTIDNNTGFVGIGTTNPSEQLEVVGSAIIDQNLSVQHDVEVFGQLKLANVPSTSSNENSLLLSIGSGGLINAFPAQQIVSLFYENKPCLPDGNGHYPQATWSNNGESSNPVLYAGVGCPAKVGIGTANPQAKLHVQGNAKIRFGLEVGSANSNTSKLEVRSDAIFDKSVAIGTDIQDGYDLAVCGNIRAADVKVHAVSDWCDYVFEDDYELKSLEEVEAFIEQNKHLPEIPSAVEVETEGIQVSEMLQLMMKKIEELTLYTIEQDKRIKELENTK